MFQTLKYLAVVGGVTFVAGNRLLRRVAQKYVTQTHAHTHTYTMHTHIYNAHTHNSSQMLCVFHGPPMDM